ncbi:MAG: Gfo/Idh/MocA family oxidoreductase [Enterocloster clostridioformis]
MRNPYRRRKELGISTDRCYEDYRAMARAEGEREDGIDFVVVVTPNQSHYEICRAFWRRESTWPAINR